MISTGLLVRLDARRGQEDEVEAFLRSAQPLVEAEPATIAWFAVRFGRGEYGIIDVFPDEAGRNDHLSGAVASALGERSEELFATPPDITKLAIVAHKLPDGTFSAITKGILLTFTAK